MMSIPGFSITVDLWDMAKWIDELRDLEAARVITERKLAGLEHLVRGAELLGVDPTAGAADTEGENDLESKLAPV